MKKTMNLSGLKLVYGGLILQIVAALFAGRLATSMMTGGTAAGLLFGAIGVLALVLVLVGLARVREASPFFGKARKAFLVQLVLQIVLTIILTVAGIGGWSLDSIRNAERSSVVEALVLFVILLIVWIVSMLIAVRTMLRACGHVAEQADDIAFSAKCIKSWRLWYMAFLLTVMMILAGLAIIVTVLRKTLESGSEGEDLAEAIFTNVSSSVLLASIIITVVLIFFLIAHLLYLSKIRVTCRQYHLREVTEQTTPQPVLMDYVQRELGRTDGGEETGGPVDWEETDLIPGDEGEEQMETGAEPENALPPEAETNAAPKERRISGRRYHRIGEEPVSGDGVDAGAVYKDAEQADTHDPEGTDAMTEGYDAEDDLPEAVEADGDEDTAELLEIAKLFHKK